MGCVTIPAQGGVDPESIETVRQRAPYAFRTQERAVTPGNYATHSTTPRGAACRGDSALDGAGAAVTVDRLAGLDVEAVFETELRQALERYRMAGLIWRSMVHASCPWRSTCVCVQPTYFRSDVKAALREVFSNRTLPDGRRGVFHPDNFTFGQPVYLSRLYTAAYAVPGVASVRITTFQRQGRPDPRPLEEGKLSLCNGWRSCAWIMIPTSWSGVCFAYSWRRQMNQHTCGCCAGRTAQTARELSNRPGLTAIAYRVGTQAQFKQRMLAPLGHWAGGAGALQTREDDDFAIACLDAWATVADVLTFYQERLANEAYLRTATERLSLVHLARAIGYELQPGVAASTSLAFTLEEALGPQRTPP